MLSRDDVDLVLWMDADAIVVDHQWDVARLAVRPSRTPSASAGSHTKPQSRRPKRPSTLIQSIQQSTVDVRLSTLVYRSAHGISTFRRIFDISSLPTDCQWLADSRLRGLGHTTVPHGVFLISKHSHVMASVL
eukprot:6076012-Pyramimonas_sp.AAC.1